MKNIFKWICLVVVLLLSGCSDGDFEDKDMTHAFVEKHQKELNVIEEFENTKGNRLFLLSYKPKGGSFIYDEYHSCNFSISFTKSIFSFGKYSLLFTEEDIVQYGKNYMFDEAEKCLSSIVQMHLHTIEKNKAASAHRDEQLNQKFIGEK